MAKLKANKPTADVLMNSMRAMGYSFEAAIADIVDNSVSAQARNIVLRFPIDPSDCCVAVCDDGIGMNKKELLDAMKYGSQLKSANRSEDDLGRFGLGMKAASLSQCRRLTVASKKDGKLSAYIWDLDIIEEKKDWYMVDCSKEQIAEIRYVDFLSDKESGTIVLWENFDLIEKSSGNVYAELGKHQNATAEYLYLTTVACKPHIVSKGKNWVMKEFGNDISKEYRGNNDSFNEFYFKKGICAAIIFRAVDNYLESHKDSEKRPTGFWYKVGGYKLNIVPYTIAKILSKIPDGYSLNWSAIWQKQALSPAFMHEIEIVTKQTNDFICDSHGMIVTEYCKKESTWEDYKADKTYTPSVAFMDELVPVSLIKEEETSAKKEAKESNDLKVVMGVVALGPGYWSKLMNAGIRRSMLSYQEQTLLKQVVQLSSTGNIPVSASGKVPYKTMNMIRSVLSIKEKLESEGISVTNGENV